MKNIFLFSILFALINCTPEKLPEINQAATEDLNISVKNILALIELDSPTEGMEVLVLGYHTPKDGGGGVFFWDKKSDEKENGGTIFMASKTKTGRWKRKFIGLINVNWFGTKGNGLEDDFSPLNKAFQYAEKMSLDVFIPKGTYRINSGYNSQIGFRLVTPNNFKIFGEEGAKLSTNLGLENNFTLFYILYGGKNFSIEKLHFENTHPLTGYRTTAVYIIQGNGTPLANSGIEKCIFTGFSTSILLNGTEDFTINLCKFFAPKGRDNAKITREPAVFIWLHSNSNGNSKNTIIKNCYAQCYSGNNILNTSQKIAMDGFTFGVANGTIIDSNIIIGASHEAIFLQPKLEFLSLNDRRPTVIKNNIINSKPPMGSSETSNYGIRVDDSEVVITGNTIRNIKTGILYYGFDYPYNFKNITISNNKIYLSPIGRGNKSGIVLIGNNFFQTNNILIENNLISLKKVNLKDNANLFHFAYLSNVNLITNICEIESLNRNNFLVNIYKFDMENNNFTFNGNKIIGKYDNLYWNTPLSNNTNFINF